MAFPKSKMAAGRHFGFYFLRISSRRDALVLVRAYSCQNFNILAQTAQKLWTIFEIKMATGGHLEFLR